MQSLFNLWSFATSGHEAMLIALCILLACGWQCIGLIVSRQWYLLPLVCGLTGLAAFLLNPIADSSSTVDLREQLLSPNIVLAIGTLQLTAVSISVILALRLATGAHTQRWQLLLGMVHCLPSPAVLLGALLLEQQWLSQQVGVRPEWVGLQVGTMVAGMLFIGCGLAYGLRDGRRVQVHLLISLMLGTVLCTCLSVDRALPAGTMQQTTQAVLNSLIPGFAIAAVCMAIGFAWAHRQRPRVGTLRHARN